MSKLGKSKHQLWHELCELIAKNPEKVCLSVVFISVFTCVCRYACVSNVCVCIVCVLYECVHMNVSCVYVHCSGP